MGFAEKIVVVTGAGHGIGRAIAERFAREGARIVVNDVDEARAMEVASSLGTNAIPAVGDVSSPLDVERLFDLTISTFGGVDVLVNNAALLQTERHFLEADDEWWSRIISVNLSGSFYCSIRAAKMMARKQNGVIINISSGGATKAHRGNAAYDAAKGGIEAVTRAMALDLAPYGIRVNAIVPGFVRTYPISDEEAAIRGMTVPIGRLANPDDIAGPALFLATPEAAYITGQCLVVDGGVLIQQRSPQVDIFPLSRFPLMP